MVRRFVDVIHFRWRLSKFSRGRGEGGLGCFILVLCYPTLFSGDAETHYAFLFKAWLIIRV